jgi:hypothetical protein
MLKIAREKENLLGPRGPHKMLCAAEQRERMRLRRAASASCAGALT